MVFSISQYGELVGVSASTIRYYEEENILPKAERRGRKRVYYPTDVHRLKLIVTARNAGFGIQEIKRIIRKSDKSVSFKSAVIKAAQTKENSIDKQIQALETQREILRNAQSCLCKDFATCSAYH